MVCLVSAFCWPALRVVRCCNSFISFCVLFLSQRCTPAGSSASFCAPSKLPDINAKAQKEHQEEALTPAVMDCPHVISLTIPTGLWTKAKHCLSPSLQSIQGSQKHGVTERARPSKPQSITIWLCCSWQHGEALESNFTTDATEAAEPKAENPQGEETRAIWM